MNVPMDRTNPRWCRGSNYNTSLPNCPNYDIMYTGQACEIDIFNDEIGFVTFVLILQASVISGHILLFIWAIVGLYAKLSTRRARLTSIYSFVIYAGMVINMLKIIEVFDPHGFYGISPPLLETTVTWIGNALVNCTCILGIGVFHDMVTAVFIDDFDFRIAKFGTIIFSLLYLGATVIILIIAFITKNTGTWIFVLNIIFFSSLALVAINNFFVLPKLTSMVKATKSKDIERVCRLLIIAGIALVAYGLLTGSFAVVSSYYGTREYFFHWFIFIVIGSTRYLDLVIVACLYLVSLDPPRRAIGIIIGVYTPSSGSRTTSKTASKANN